MNGLNIFVFDIHLGFQSVTHHTTIAKYLNSMARSKLAHMRYQVRALRVLPTLNRIGTPEPWPKMAIAPPSLPMARAKHGHRLSVHEVEIGAVHTWLLAAVDGVRQS